MRTIQVVNVRWHNATAWYGLELARLLNDAGHETLVIGLPGTESFERAEALNLAPVPLALNSVNPLVLTGVFREMHSLVCRFRPQVVNCHRGEGYFLWALLRQMHSFALVRTRGDQRLPRNTAGNRFLHRKATDALITTNSRMARHFETVLGVPQARIHPIFGGVDTRTFAFDPQGRENVRARYGFAPEHRVLGLLGRFDEVKGQRELIAATAGLVRAGFPVKLLLLGFTTATTQETVEGWITEAGMGEHIRITGLIRDVAAHLSAVDIGVVASLWSETIARAALEFMAARRPLLSTSVGVMPDLLLPQALCAPADAHALETLIRRALTEPALLSALLADQNKRLPGLSREAFLEQTLKVYNSFHC